MKTYFKIIQLIRWIFMIASSGAAVWIIAGTFFCPEILNADTQNLLWDLSHFTLFFVMIIRPLSDLLPCKKWFCPLIVLRKEMGIFSAMIVVMFGVVKYVQPDFNFISTYFSLPYWGFDRYQFWGHLGELTGFILLITSNKFSQRTLGKWWKTVQELAYVYFFSGCYYVWALYEREIMLWMMGTGALLWLLAEVLKKQYLCPRRFEKV